MGWLWEIMGFLWCLWHFCLHQQMGIFQWELGGFKWDIDDLIGKLMMNSAVFIIGNCVVKSYRFPWGKKSP
jgi:hypothetical protein